MATGKRTDRKRKEKKEKWRKWRSFIPEKWKQWQDKMPKKWRYLLIIVASVIALAVVGYASILFGGMLVVDGEELDLAETTTFETADGQVIGQLYSENRDSVPLEEISDHLENAFLAVEDRDFYNHMGVDISGIARALVTNIIAGGPAEGGSTITQQLVKNLYLTNDKTWTRKIKEAMGAMYLEVRLNKDEIIALYLNQIYFGHGVYGVEKASNFFFSKPASELTVPESALLAGLAKAPNGYSPINHPEKALERRNVVLGSMQDAGVITEEEQAEFETQPLGLNVQDLSVEPNPSADSYIDLVIDEAEQRHGISVDNLRQGGYQIVVNMDPTQQQIAYEEMQNGDYFPGNTEGTQGAFMMMENETGKITAAIGGRDYQLGNLNRVNVQRQPGSVIKPIAVYGPAMIHENQFTPYSLLPDEQMDIDGYTVGNANNQYEGQVTLYEALVESKNTSTVWLLDQIGVDYAKSYLEQMGIQLEDNGLSIGLGGLSDGITPQKMMESYGTFARNGEFIESVAIDQIYDQRGELVFEAEPETRSVFSPQVAWNMTVMLQDVVESGTGTAGNYDKALAGKTGSTQHPHVEGETKDAWFVGYTPEYVSAMWMGYDSSDENHYLTGGSSYPTALTKAIFTEIDNQQSLESEFTKPENVEDVEAPVDLSPVSDLTATYEFGGLTLIRGRLSWTGNGDDRVVYRIYSDQEGEDDELVGEVQGETEFVIDHALFSNKEFYVVPYDPLTDREGERSETVELSW